MRWGNPGGQAFGYVPCGCEVHAERAFGDLRVPGRLSVGSWFGTPRYAPFFEAEIRSLTPVDDAQEPDARALGSRVRPDA